MVWAANKRASRARDRGIERHHTMGTMRAKDLGQALRRRFRYREVVRPVLLGLTVVVVIALAGLDASSFFTQ
jgi:hypothetical protein